MSGDMSVVVFRNITKKKCEKTTMHKESNKEGGEGGCAIGAPRYEDMTNDAQNGGLSPLTAQAQPSQSQLIPCFPRW